MSGVCDIFFAGGPISDLLKISQASRRSQPMFFDAQLS